MTDLERYIERMSKEYNKFSWEIGWESLPKYIGHKIYNRNTKQIVTVQWDEGDYYPKFINENGEEIDYYSYEFRHDRAFWIYKVGEDYN